MVFFVIACTHSGREEEEAKQTVTNILGSGNKALGELY